MPAPRGNSLGHVSGEVRVYPADEPLRTMESIQMSSSDSTIVKKCGRCDAWEVGHPGLRSAFGQNADLNSWVRKLVSGQKEYPYALKILYSVASGLLELFHAWRRLAWLRRLGVSV